MATKQTNIVSNPERHLIFFEGEELAYNYATDQWSRVPAYDNYGMYTVKDKSYDIGLVVYSSGSVDLQEQQVSDDAQNACIATGAIDLNQGARTMISGIRPLINGGTVTVQAGSRDDVGDSVDWATARSVNARSGFAGFRTEGRYMSAQVNVTGDFNTLMGVDVDFVYTSDV